jgi:predicted O-linked N-acetylglucosamine transferase (SPINDLY family)
MGLFNLFRSSKSKVPEELSSEAKIATPREEAQRLIDKGNAIEEQGGQLDEAMRCYDAAVGLAPDFARAHMNRGNILLARGASEEALSAYGRALEIDPDYAAAHYNAGNAHARLNHHDAACSAYEKAVELDPNFTDAHVALGCTLEELGQVDKAAASYRKALEIAPNYAEVHCNLGRTLLSPGRQEEAIASFQRSLELQPDNADVWLILGTAQKARGYLEAAQSSLMRAHEVSPGNLEILLHLGDTCLDLEQADHALACYRKAVEIDPKNAVAHNNMGNVHFSLGQFFEAEASYRRAVELQPDFSAAHGNLGCVMKDIGQPLESLKSLRRAIEIAPDDCTVRSNMLFIGHLMEDKLPTTLFEEAKAFGKIAAQKAKPVACWNNTPNPERRLRVGFVSGDLQFHPVGFFIEGVLSALASRNSGKLEIFAYTNSFRVDPATLRIKSHCDHWREVFGRMDNEVAEMIREDQIDILIDLSGHTAKNRLPVFAWKPSPIQVTWLGYFATTGVEMIDYLIADPWTLHTSEEAYFTETIWRLPETRLCFTPPDVNVVIRPLPALSEQIITFGCFNNLNKMNDQVVAVWARVLTEVPNSRLFLKARQLYQSPSPSSSPARDAVIKQFAGYGIEASRLVLEGPDVRENYFAAYNRVDIALDPFPYTGGTTTAEALWMGVPVLTLAGKDFLGRQGVGLLMNAGLNDWVANDLDDYVARAVAHAKDIEGLSALRARLREHVLSSPVFDASRFAMHLEEALRSMWQKWCSECGEGVLPSE